MIWQAPPPVEALTVAAPPVAILACTLRRDRTLQDCTVTQATPALCGFGTAALRMAQHMTLQPGSERPGRRVEVPLRFEGVEGCPRPDQP